jgi:tRNA threonylcarbamoyladenosine modification (KEOPS) complex  Pcc1 subunit
MPRIAAAAEVAPFAVAGTPLPPPTCLTPVEAAYWRQIVSASPASRFDAGSVSVLTGKGRAAAATRAMFLQLAASARDQSRLVATLSTKLRLIEQTKRKSVAETERRKVPSGPRPWDDIPERHDN